MQTLWQDLRYAARMLRQNPGFSAVAVIALALGIGATTAIFSVVDAVMLRLLPYPEPDRVIWVAQYLPGIKLEALIGPDYIEWRDQNGVFDSMAAFERSQLTVTGLGDPLRIRCGTVTQSFLKTFRVNPLLGRAFLPEEDRAGGPKAILLSYGFWQRQFGGDPGVVGRTLTLEGQPYAVIGVLPASFRFPEQVSLDALTTFQLDERAQLDRKQMRILHAAGRLKPGVTLEQARANLETLLANSRRRDPKFYGNDVKLVAIPLGQHQVKDVRLALLVLLGAVGCVLAIACANVANLLLARAAGRRREIALRAALGAGRWRLARQLLTESAMLGVAGGSAGLLLVVAAIRTLVHLAPAGIPRIDDVSVDWRVLAFAMLVSLLTGIVFGLVPAFSAGQADLNETLKAGAGRGSAGGAHGRLRSALVIGEVALSLILLVGAGLLVESLWRLENTPAGFEAQHVLAIDLPVRGTAYQQGSQRAELYRALTERLRRLPGVTAVAAVDNLPPSGIGTFQIFSREDMPPPERGHRGDTILVRHVTPQYSSVMGISLRRGRLFTEQEMAEGAGVAVVNETLVRRYFPGENPLGKGIMGHVDGRWNKIVGIVADVKNSGLKNPVEPEMDVPFPLTNGYGFQFLIRTAADPRGAMELARGEVRAFDRNLPANIRPLATQVDEEFAGPRFNTLLLAVFAGVALVLAAVGIYGVMSYAVTQRTQEIGIRMALGAEAHDVLRLVLRQAMTVTAAGVALGVAGGVGLTRYLESMLYGVKARDWATFVCVVLFMAVVALAASFLPARRATRVDPMSALRTE